MKNKPIVTICFLIVIAFIKANIYVSKFYLGFIFRISNTSLMLYDTNVTYRTYRYKMYASLNSKFSVYLQTYCYFSSMSV